jgi:HK97 gp10 family phage protein
MDVELRLTGLDGVLDTLKSLPPEIVSKRGGPVRAALRKGAVVILKAEQANLQRSLANEPRYSTGLLMKNLVVTRGKAPSDGNGERYLVRVRRKVYPGKSGRSGGGKATTTLKAAQLLEYGSSKQQAEPWIRPAFESKAREAIETVERELLRSIERIVKKLAQQNKGK